MTFGAPPARRAAPVSAAMVDEASINRRSGNERCIDHAIRGKCSPRDADLVLTELAERQHGVVARRQLLAAGVGRRAIDERLGRRLHPIHRGIYAVGYPVLRVEARWMAAALAAGPEAVLSHRTAGQLWSLVPRSGHRLEITRPTYFRPLRGIRGHRSALPEDERTVVDGIPVTTVPRTILDLTTVVPRRQVERALNEVEVRRLTDPLSIPDLLARYPRRRGSAVLRALLDDGAEAHGVTKNEAFEAHRERDRVLMSDGWRVVRITWRQLRDAQSSIADDLRKALAQGRALH